MKESLVLEPVFLTKTDSIKIICFFNTKKLLLLSMIHQITKGIKISVKTTYSGTSYNHHNLYYAFSYAITIENNSEETVQLTDRYWEIIDTLNKTEIVEGEGVVGQTPILTPNDSYTYSSGCFLRSNLGAMKGFYLMTNQVTLEQFKVMIPTFQLTSQPLLN
jgi:ApaG protein